MRGVRRFPSLWWTALACLWAVPAAAQEGLKVEGASFLWPTLPARVRLNAMLVDPMPVSTSLAVAHGGYARSAPAASVVGDYYFFADPPGGQAPQGGLRASSALLLRPSGMSWSELSLGSRSLASGGHAWRATAPSLTIEPPGEGLSALPYLGIGYSSLGARSGWGFWADLGLVVQNPAGALGLARAVSGGQGVDDVLRELRLSPLFQLGVNYSF